LSAKDISAFRLVLQDFFIELYHEIRCAAVASKKTEAEEVKYKKRKKTGDFCLKDAQRRNS